MHPEFDVTVESRSFELFVIGSFLADLQGAEVFMKVQGLAQGHSGRVACTQLIHGKISVDAARS